MKTILDALLWIWQLPQNLAGLVVRLAWGWAATEYKGTSVVYASRFPGGISLGRYLVVNRPLAEDQDKWNHEWGHSRQSLYLGPLYLLVIGLPSVLWAWWWNPHRGVSYYWFYTESWANRLGGVTKR